MATELKICAFDSIHPGGMSQRADGGYIRRDDPASLAGALVALILSGDRAAEDAQAQAEQAKLEQIALARAAREDAIAECRDAAHDAIHESIADINECRRVQEDVDCALVACRIRADEPVPESVAMRALRLILPLAKGYAAAHPVGSNAEHVAQAERALTGEGA